MPRVGFEPTILVFEWSMTIFTLHGAANVIGNSEYKHEIKCYAELKSVGKYPTSRLMKTKKKAIYVKKPVPFYPFLLLQLH
jgi:hypothetical protein